MKKYTSVPTEIEAIRWTGDNFNEIASHIPDRHLVPESSNNPLQVWNHVDNQWLNVPTGHYIIKGTKGEYYPCDPEVLKEKYRPSVTTGNIEEPYPLRDSQIKKLLIEDWGQEVFVDQYQTEAKVVLFEEDLDGILSNIKHYLSGYRVPPIDIQKFMRWYNKTVQQLKIITETDAHFKIKHPESGDIIALTGDKLIGFKAGAGVALEMVEEITIINE